jgi:formylglycine-generating enzyme required for sulfatase activity/acyl carrier protein
MNGAILPHLQRDSVMTHSLLRACPPRGEVECRVLEILCETLRYPSHSFTLDSDILTEFRLDSIDIFDLVYRIETAYPVYLPDDAFQLFFVSRPFTVRNAAELILCHWDTARPVRDRETVPDTPWQHEPLPFTQCGGSLAEKDWQDGPLYESLGLNREGRPQYRRRTDGMRCLLLPEAEAWIGSEDAAALDDQRPLHRVPLNRFLIDAEPVSVTAYGRFLNSIGLVSTPVLNEWGIVEKEDRRASHFPLRRSWWGRWVPIRGTERQPMILTSWYGANAYALWANRRDWRHYRSGGALPNELDERKAPAPPPPDGWMGSFLPSEAQWEYAARGPEPRTYPWGDEPPRPAQLCSGRHHASSMYRSDGLLAAQVSARQGMSPFGLHHVAGNVWQWCRDWYAPDFYRSRGAVRPDAQNDEPSGVRCERGGSWVGPQELARSSYRRGRPPIARGRCLGFRCAGLPDDLS